MDKSLKFLLKILAAGCVAVLILSVPCLVYHDFSLTIPIREGVTDTTAEPYHRYSSATEGFGYGRTNNEGYNNLLDYNAQRIDILIMGSSQMEGYQIPQRKIATALLNNLLDGSKYVYNIGVSSHSFYTVANNFERAVKYYHPKQYAVIETGSVQFDTHALEDVLNYQVKWLFQDRESNISGIRGLFRNSLLYKIPYIRLLWYQISILKKNRQSNTIKTDTTLITEDYTQNLNAVISRLRQTCAENVVKPLIFYHPHLRLNKDGSVSAATDDEYLATFKNACDANDVLFVDMTGAFISAYNTRRVLPHGFLNTAVGAGHLNKNGHAIIAAELFKRIQEQQ
jgi:hypothetical protein